MPTNRAALVAAADKILLADGWAHPGAKGYECVGTAADVAALAHGK